MNRAQHLIHLRCELPHHTTLPLFEALMTTPEVALVSLMDHSPGQRQFATPEKYREYYQGKYHLNDAEMDAFETEQRALSERWSTPNRLAIAAHCRERGIALASHDDATAAHVHESLALGSVIAEFPTTETAAQASHASGMKVLMGAPNIVRGGSLRQRGGVPSGGAGLLDILSSDYYPASLLDAAFRLAADERNPFTLPQTVAMVSANPAQSVGLDDRGRIADGLRADLVLAHHSHGQVRIRQVWAQGRQVF